MNTEELCLGICIQFSLFNGLSVINYGVGPVILNWDDGKGTFCFGDMLLIELQMVRSAAVVLVRNTLKRQY